MATAREVQMPRTGREYGQGEQAQQGVGSKLFGVVRMGIFWYFAMQMFSTKKPISSVLLTDNLFTKGENLVRHSSLCSCVLFVLSAQRAIASLVKRSFAASDPSFCLSFGSCQFSGRIVVAGQGHPASHFRRSLCFSKPGRGFSGCLATPNLT